MITRFERSRQGAIYGPSETIQPVAKRQNRYAETFRPFSHTRRLTSEGQSSAATTIARLLCKCRPFAILRLVALLIVETFNGMLRRRLRTHVLVEVHELIPARANSDTSSAVVRESSVPRIETAHAHHLPAFIFWRVAHAVNAMWRRHVLQASTTFDVAEAQIGRAGEPISTAVAATQPVDARDIALACRSYRNESAETLSSYVQRVRMQIARPVATIIRIFSRQTSTTFRVTGLQCVAADEYLCSAGAYTTPHDTAAFSLARWFNDRQSPSDHSSQVCYAWMCGQYTRSSHVVSSLSGDDVVRGRGALITFFGLANYTSVSA
jgi:hypothetical protein